jgi:mono/diheme cytochrome c family protein
VEKTLPSFRYGPIGRGLLLAGKLPLFAAEVVDPKAPLRTAPPEGPTADYGRYLGMACRGCHGTSLSGGPVPGTPPSFKPARNITPAAIGGWEEADFFRAVREGKRPDGAMLDAFMPYRFLKFMTDDEIRAIWAYLKTVPPKEYGER